METRPSLDTAIQHVSDTALWVAHYRALENERAEPLFRDPLAKILVGERGRKIAESMRAVSPYARWTIVIRTMVIDEFIRKAVTIDGVETVINLGAGLDTRPYRMDLPKSLRWIEVDFPHMIEHKNSLLGAETPGVRLERIAADLSDHAVRRELLARIGKTSGKTLVLTEGVIPYLTEDQVAALADDLRAEPNFAYWITEYFAPEIYLHFQSRERRRQMRNAPFVFFPANWWGFFERHGWKQHEIRYLPIEGLRLNRPMPLPWWARLMIALTPRQAALKRARGAAYVVMTPKEKT